MPFDKFGLFIKDINDNTITVISELKQQTIKCDGAITLRGNSQCILHNNEYIAICHSMHNFESKSEYACYDNSLNLQQYAFHLVSFSKDFSKCKVFNPFIFLGSYVSFLCGITIDDDNTIHMPITLNDCDTYIASIKLDTLKKFTSN